MKDTSVRSINNVYSCNNNYEVTWHNISQPDLKKFCINMRDFEYKLGSTAYDDYWNKFLRQLRRFRFQLCAAPLSFNSSAISTPDFFESLLKYLSACSLFYPAFEDIAESIVTEAKLLSQSSTNPLLDVLREICTDGGKEKAALLLHAHRLMPAVEHILSIDEELAHIEVLKANQLRGNSCYSKIIVVGPTRWFPEYCFNAPRAVKIHILLYNWLRDYWKPEGLLASYTKGADKSNNGFRVIISEKIHGKIKSEGVEELIDPEEILLPTDFPDIGTRNSVSSSDRSNQEYVEARILNLEGDTIVALADDESASILSLDLEEDDDSFIKRKSAIDVEQGMFVLLRTSGGGDFVVEVADRLLGDRASSSRKKQKHWKDLLRERVERESIYKITWELRKLGSGIASEQNVRNWMSEKKIKPQGRKDFSAILNLIGLEDKEEEYWRNAILINRAHMKAGQRIRSLLLLQVRESDLSKLEVVGKMEFHLGEVGGGSITAFRVIEISKEKYLVPASRIGHPVGIDDDF